MISLQRFGSGLACPAPGTAFPSAAGILQILLSYAPFFSTRYVKVQLFRLKVGVVQSTFRASSLGFVSRFRVGFE